MSGKSRFRLEHANGTTKIIDLSTGEEITSLCRRVEFSHETGGVPRLTIVLFQDYPEIDIVGRLEKGRTDR